MSGVNARDLAQLPSAADGNNSRRRHANDRETVQPPLQQLPSATGANRENFKADAVAVEAVDRPKAGGDEFVSGVSACEKFQHIRAHQNQTQQAEEAEHPAPTQVEQQEGTYTFV